MEDRKTRPLFLIDGPGTGQSSAQSSVHFGPGSESLWPGESVNHPEDNVPGSIPFTDRPHGPAVMTRDSAIFPRLSMTHSALLTRCGVSLSDSREGHARIQEPDSVGSEACPDHESYPRQDRGILHIPAYPTERNFQGRRNMSPGVSDENLKKNPKVDSVIDEHHCNMSPTCSGTHRQTLLENGTESNSRQITHNIQPFYSSQPCFPQNESKRVYGTGVETASQSVDLRDKRNMVSSYLSEGASKLSCNMFNLPFPRAFHSPTVDPSTVRYQFGTRPPFAHTFHNLSPFTSFTGKDGGQLLDRDNLPHVKHSDREDKAAWRTGSELSCSADNFREKARSRLACDEGPGKRSDGTLSLNKDNTTKNNDASLSCTKQMTRKQSDNDRHDKNIPAKQIDTVLSVNENVPAKQSDKGHLKDENRSGKQSTVCVSFTEDTAKHSDAVHVQSKSYNNSAGRQSNSCLINKRPIAAKKSDVRLPSNEDVAVKETDVRLPGTEGKVEKEDSMLSCCENRPQESNAGSSGNGDQKAMHTVSAMRTSVHHLASPTDISPIQKKQLYPSLTKTSHSPLGDGNPQSVITSAVVSPTVHSDSDTDEYVEAEQKPVIRDCFVLVEDEASRKAKQVLDAIRKPDSERVNNHTAESNLSKLSSKKRRKCARSTSYTREKLDNPERCISDYEPPSQQKVSSVPRTTSRRVLPSRQKSTISSYMEYSDSDSGNDGASKIQRGSKTEKKNIAISNNVKINLTQSSAPAKLRGKLLKKNAGSRTCPECHKTFTRADSLTVHMRVHTGDRPFHCKECDATYKVSSHLTNHIRSRHSNLKEYKCENCSKAFSTSNARRRHEKSCGKDFSERIKHQCSRCHKQFVTAEGYERHKNLDSCCLDESDINCVESNRDITGDVGENENKNDRKKLFRCTDCGKAFVESSGLDCHRQFLCGKSPGAGPYTCPQCNKTFMRWNRYIGHARRHAGDRPYRCSHCTSRFFDRDSLRKHVSRHNGKYVSKCSLCEKQFTIKRSLAMHIMRVHCGMKPYKCNECDRDFASAKLLSMHIRRIHRKEKRFKCQLCTKAFFESQAWMKHMILHGNGKAPSVRGPVQQYPCNLCGKVLNMRNMRLHVSAEHPGVALSEAVTKDLVTCKMCLKEFSDSSSLKIHMIRHSGVKQFKCDLCDMAFVTVHALQLHQRKHTDARPYSCEECHETFRWRASLRDHKINQHNPDLEAPDADGRRFACKECGQRFKRFNSLKTHMIRHRSVMPCICSECGKGFTDTTRLKIHMSCHNGSDRPFICETCGAGFFYTFLLKRHIQSRHKPSPWLCNLCGRSLCSKDALKRHLRHHANSPDGKVRVGGNRGRTRKAKEPKESRSQLQRAELTKDKDRCSESFGDKGDCRVHDAEVAISKNGLRLIPSSDKNLPERVCVDIRKASNLQPSRNMFPDQNYLNSVGGFLMNSGLWTKPEGSMF